MLAFNHALRRLHLARKPLIEDASAATELGVEGLFSETHEV
jgi:hypothetical protein